MWKKASLVTKERVHAERTDSDTRKNRRMMDMCDEKLYHYECKNPNCERKYALREVILTGTLNRPTCARSKVIDVMVDRETRRTEKRRVTYWVCGPRQCGRSREDVCHCGTRFDWPTRPADVPRDTVSPEFQDLLDQMWFDDDFARGVKKIARDYSKGIHQGGPRVDPEMIELEVEIASIDTRSEVGGLDEEVPEEEDLVA